MKPCCGPMNWEDVYKRQEFERIGVDVISGIAGGERCETARQGSGTTGQFTAGFFRIQVRCDVGF